MAAKRAFVVVDDYGMGGIWMLIRADSAAQIKERWPDLDVMQIGDPEWITGEELAKIKKDWISEDMEFDIDDEPFGYLAKVARRS